MARSRFEKEEGWEVFTGNELLVKGCLETEGGTHLWTGYPGSPVSGFFDTAYAIRELIRRLGIRVTMANNEALAAAMVNGSQMAPLRAIAVQKSVGVHVAADALALGNLVGPHPGGGVVIVLGDDPWSESTQVPSDSRFIAKHLFMPVLEPADFQELKDWIDIAFRLSRESELYIGYLVNTNQADGGGSVRVRPNHAPAIRAEHLMELDTSAIDLERNVLLPPRTWHREETIKKRFERLWQSARHYGVDRVEPVKECKVRIGFITAGEAYCYLRHALSELGMDGLFPILKLGITYPIDPHQVERFFVDLDHVIVVEQRRPFIEEQVVAIAQRLSRHGLRVPQIWGKELPAIADGIPDTRGLNPSILVDRLGRLFLRWNVTANIVPLERINEELRLLEKVSSAKIPLPVRTPTFCPGCPHRDSASVLMEIRRLFADPDYMRRVHGRGPIDLVFHGDTGCYTMLMFEPTQQLMHNYSGMGLGGGTGAGIDPFIRNKQVVFMGDSTFFHSGMIAISNSLKNGHDITYIILDNQATAMTGHQTTPGRSDGLLGEETFAQRIESIVEAMTQSELTGATVVVANPADRERYRRLLEKTILKDGVKVVIARKECSITYQRRKREHEQKLIDKHGFVPIERHINVATDVCEGCLECTKATGCPGLTLVETQFGMRIATDRTWCVDDGACTRFSVPVAGGKSVKACPCFEEVIISRRRPVRTPIEHLGKINVPLPQQARCQDCWRIYSAGVGGMGIGTLSAVMVLAAHYDGLRVLFCDKKGLAIRNGSVYSMVTVFTPAAPYTSNQIPFGKADLLLGIDLLEAARAVDGASPYRVASPQKTAIIVNRHITPTVRALLGKDQLEPERYEAFLRQCGDPDRFFACDVSMITERFFGTQKVVNLVMLGIAFQRGELPFSLDSIKRAIRETFGRNAEENLLAFKLGRWIAADLDKVLTIASIPRQANTFAEIVREEKANLAARHKFKRSVPARYEQWMYKLRERLNLPEDLLVALAIRVYDLVEYEGFEYAERYVKWVERFSEAEVLSGQSLKATTALISNLHKLMAIKDEIYVADLLTRKEKYQRDQARFHVDPRQGDQISYRHFNRLELRILGLSLSFDIVTRDWMLRFVRHLKILRRLLPWWHKQEREFLEWYLGLLPRLLDIGRKTGRWLEISNILRVPESVSGFREIRYPKMVEAKQRAQLLLQELEQSAKMLVGLHVDQYGCLKK